MPDYPLIEEGDVACAVGALRQRLLQGDNLRMRLEGTADHVADGGGVLGHLASDRGVGGGVHRREQYRQGSDSSVVRPVTQPDARLLI